MGSIQSHPEWTAPRQYAGRPNHSSTERAPAPRGSNSAAKKVAEIFAAAGIEIGGNRPWDLQVYDARFYQGLLAEGSIAAGESYMDGWWDAEALDELCTRVHRSGLSAKVGEWEILWLALKARLFNRQTRSRSATVAQEHYNLANDIYQAMLDPWMQYTCGYWKDAATLDEAQEHKLRLICRKIQLEPGMKVLDLGGGFGGLAHFIASRYACSVVSYNISGPQVAFGRDLCRNLPVRFEERDYRLAAREAGDFDRVVSVGLCEHIGYKNYRNFLELAHAQLAPGGLFLLHTIGGNASYTCTDAWMDKYIFPNGMVPSVAQLGAAMEALWVVEDWHNFGPDYDKTLVAWWENLDRVWPTLQHKYSERFYRMWKYYLLGSAGGFRSRKLQLWQLVLSKGDIPSYNSIR